jgi:hypothetical protein
VRILAFVQVTVAKLLPFLIFLSGCGVKAIPGDGSLVQVHLAEGFSAVQKAGFAKGVLYWDKVGARLRLEGDGLPTAEQPAAHLYLEQSGTALISMAWTDVTTATIRFDMEKIASLNELGCATLIAHESGHALGLQHNPGANVMDPEPYPMHEISAEDVTEFRNVWPAQ